MFRVCLSLSEEHNSSLSDLIPLISGSLHPSVCVFQTEG